MFSEIKESIWPKGSYSLISTVFGCPEGDGYGWRVGYVNISTPVQKHVQTWKMPHAHEDQNTPDPHILGPYHYYTLQLNFCTRISRDYNNSLKIDDVTMTSDAGDVSDRNTDVDDEETWPPGTYCLIQAGHSCPGGKFLTRLTMYFHIQSNFFGSNIFGTMKICSWHG